MNIVFSGSREGMTLKQKSTLCQRLYEIAGGENNLANIQSFHHGVSGESDKYAHYAARALSFWIIGHPLSEPHLQKYRFDCICDEMRQMRPALDRNQDMIDEVVASLTHNFNMPHNIAKTDLLGCPPNCPALTEGLLLATPLKDKVYRSGTYGTILRAFAAQLPVEIIQRDGTIRREI